ncbi:hypothetical protein [Ruegeria aquimaris]|uniref:Lipoprotein n=1 Tax=Ruegeria aquimaris TaxID=2984333 RepID=A0ABT3ANM7_9RHOB|nr:hypothetical protein [Ruegeria sp. XHP0148]MCV2890192.1 hypothetical protein [Ruegeria sp. XHP0148]
MSMTPTSRQFQRAVLAMLIGALAVTAACTRTKRENRLLFGGHYFPVKAKPVDKKVSLANFTVTVDKASQSPDDAREAGRHGGTVYCIGNYGTSEIEWSLGPDSDPAQLRIVDDKLTFSGTCQRP